MKSYPKYKPSKIVWYPEIPENWDYCKVKHIANTYAGGTPSTVVDSFWHNGDIPWLPSGKLQNCEIISAEKFITNEGLIGSSTKWIKPNTVLVALTGATCANIGYLTFQACANQSVIAVDENPEKANSRFLYYMFLNMRSQILTHQTGGAQAGINDSDVKNLMSSVIPDHVHTFTTTANGVHNHSFITNSVGNNKEFSLMQPTLFIGNVFIFAKYD